MERMKKEKGKKESEELVIKRRITKKKEREREKMRETYPASGFNFEGKIKGILILIHSPINGVIKRKQLF